MNHEMKKGTRIIRKCRCCLIFFGILWIYLLLPPQTFATDTTPSSMDTAATLSISVKPVSGRIPAGTPGRLLVTYIGSGSDNMAVTSPEGIFLLPSGEQIKTTRKSVAMSIVNNNGAVAEAVAVPATVSAQALEQGYDYVIYRRYFNNTVKTDITLQIAHSNKGVLKVKSLTLGFKNIRTGEISRTPTVPMNSNEIITKADIHYTGSGMFRAQWKVDDQILGYDNRFLKSDSDHVTIESPAIPQLPTYNQGLHKVMLEVLHPSLPFTEPVATYSVSDEKIDAGSGIQLVGPSNGAYVAFPVGWADAPVFQWKTDNEGQLFWFELYPKKAGPDASPLIRAVTDKGTYKLSSFDTNKLAENTEYKWHVKIMAAGNTVAASLYRSIYFVKKPKGEFRFENLDIFETSKKTGLQQKRLSADSPKATGEVPQFSVNIGQSITIQVSLKNNTNLTKENLNVRFFVDDEIADTIEVSVLEPDRSIIVKGQYTVTDSKTHALKIQAVEGADAGAPELASVKGRLINPEGSRITKKTLKDSELQIGHFIIQLSEVINNDPMNYSGAGTITIPFLNNKTLNVTFQNLRLNDRMVVRGDILVSLQGMGFAPQSLGPAKLTLNTITFKPGGAECSGSLILVFPFANCNIREQKLIFNIENLTMHPDKGFSGQLPLGQDFNLKISRAFGEADITFDKGSFIALTDNIFNSNLNGHIRLPGTIASTPGEEGIPFTGFEFESDGGFYGNVIIDATKLTGKDFSIKGGIVLDFTTTVSPENFKNDPDWMGVYINDGILDVVLFNDHFQINARHLYIHNGINGTLSSPLEKIITLGKPENHFLYRLLNMDVNFRHFADNSGTMYGRITGNITVPYVNLSADTEQAISVDGIAPAMTLTQSRLLTLADTVTLNVKENSSIGFADGVITARLVSDITSLGDLGGKLQPGVGTVLILDSAENFTLESPDGQRDTWVDIHNQQTKLFDMFSIGLEKIGFGSQDGQLFFGVQGNLCLMEGFDSDPDAKIYLFIPSGKIKAKDIHVGFDEPDAFNFSGSVSLSEHDDHLGKRFEGNMELTVANLFSTPARLIAGHTGDFPYFYINGAKQIPFPGIQLTPYPISLYGFKGGAYFNMEHSNEDGYKPNPGPAELNAVIKVGTSFDDGYTFSGNLNLKITVNKNNDQKFDTRLPGEAYIMCNPLKPVIYRKVLADSVFNCLKGNDCIFTSRMDVENLPLTDPKNPLLAVTGEMDLKLGENQWYLNVKTRKNPAVIHVLPSYMKKNANGFFTMDSIGAAGSLNTEMNTTSQLTPSLYSGIEGSLTSDFPIGFALPGVYAEFPTLMKLTAGLNPKDGEIHEIFSAYVDLTGGLRTPEPTRVWVKGDIEYPILGEASSGQWSTSYMWGDPLPAIQKSSAVWPCIKDVDPEYGAEGINVASPITVTLTQPVGSENQLTFEDKSDNLYTMSVFVDSVAVNTSPANSTQSIPGHIEWNKSGTQFKFHPQTYLDPNTTYYVHVNSHAQGSPQLIPRGRWNDDYTTKFTTGSFPKDLKPLIKYSYPFNGQKYCYTQYPITINFKHPLDILSSRRLKGRLFKRDGTEIPGTHDINGPVAEGVTFTPSSPLEPNTRYIYNLMLVSPDQPKSDDKAKRSIPSTNSSVPVKKMSNIVLTLTFDTGKYASFKQMMDASASVIQVKPLFFPSYEVITYEGYKPSILRCTFNTVEPVYWEDININAESANNSPTACGWLTPRYCNNDPTCKIPEEIVNRCLTRSTEEQFVYVDNIVGRNDARQHTFDLYIKLLNYSVVPALKDCQCSIDMWNKKVSDKDFTVSMMNHIIGNSLHQALFDRTQITFSHRISPDEPYIVSVDLPNPASEENNAEVNFDIKIETKKK